MWGRDMGGGARLLPLLLLLPGAVGLECLSCGAEDGTCRGATNVTCPPESDVCAEAWAAVTWSHGRFSLGGRGCGRGQAGANARALELFGLVVFVRRHQCREGGGCNGELPLGLEGALPLPGNASGRVANGLRCYGCPDDGPCPPDAVVQCYDDLRGCFHGNVTLSLGGVTLWREVRGCVRDQSCTQESRGDDAVALRGSCCAGDLCNRHLANKTFFAPDLPRLELLPHGHAPTATPNATKMAAGATKMPAGATEMAAGAAKMPAGVTKMAAGATKMAASTTKMAAGGTPAGATKANRRVNVNVHVVNATAKMAATTPKMAATQPNGVAGVNRVDADVTGVNADITKVNAGVTRGVTVGVDLANVELANANGAAVDPAGAAGDKMAAGRAAPGAGQPRQRHDGVKGRGHPLGGPGWLLPFLLLPLL